MPHVAPRGSMRLELGPRNDSGPKMGRSVGRRQRPAARSVAGSRGAGG